MSSSSPAHNQWQAAAATVARPKMDMAKALAILGFSSSRTLDPGGGHDPKAELSNALSKQMARIEQKKKMSISKAHAQAIEARQRDDVRILHEAYQFLSRKYMIMASKSEDDDENVGISPMQILDQQSGGGYKLPTSDDAENNECENVVDDNISVENESVTVQD